MTSFFEDRTLELPEDINLPFFAYGIFKPGQIAHPKIKRFVDEYTNNVKISYLMKHRDGVPILIEGENERFQTEGTIIKFKEGHLCYPEEVVLALIYHIQLLGTDKTESTQYGEDCLSLVRTDEYQVTVFGIH